MAITQPRHAGTSMPCRLLTIAGVLIPSFLLPERLLLLGQQVAPLALVAIGQTLVVLMGLIDLSVGAVLTLSLVLGAGIARGSNGRCQSLSLCASLSGRRSEPSMGS